MTVELFNATANSMMLCLIKMIHSAPRLMPLRLLLPQARRGERNAMDSIPNFERARPASFLSIRPSRPQISCAFTIFGADGPTLTWLGALVLLFWRHLRKGYLPNKYMLVIFLHA